MYVYLNDKLIPADEAAIAISDAGFLYGAGLFETMRVQNSVVFGLTDHLDRLFLSSAKLGFDIPGDRNVLPQAIFTVLQANHLKDARVRLTLSSGSLSTTTDTPTPICLITATQLKAYPDDYYRHGILVALCPYRQNPADPLAGHKTTSYFSRMLGLQEAHQKKAAESLWFTTDGYLSEGCVSNVFLVRENSLMTPPIRTPVLPGVARETVCKIAVRENLDLIEKALTIDDLLGADEIFLTNVIMKVMPVVAIEKHVVGQGKVGSMTTRLISLFEQEIQQQCGVMV